MICVESTNVGLLTAPIDPSTALVTAFHRLSFPTAFRWPSTALVAAFHRLSFATAFRWPSTALVTAFHWSFHCACHCPSNTFSPPPTSPTALPLTLHRPLSPGFQVHRVEVPDHFGPTCARQSTPGTLHPAPCVRPHQRDGSNPCLIDLHLISLVARHSGPRAQPTTAALPRPPARSAGNTTTAVRSQPRHVPWRDSMA